MKKEDILTTLRSIHLRIICAKSSRNKALSKEEYKLVRKYDSEISLLKRLANSAYLECSEDDRELLLDNLSPHEMDTLGLWK